MRIDVNDFKEIQSFFRNHNNNYYTNVQKHLFLKGDSPSDLIRRPDVANIRNECLTVYQG